jgi:hypothetical protein
VPRHGLRAAVKNGTTTSEPRRRCACMHHGSGHCDPPDTRLWRESLVPRQRAPLGRVIPTTTSVPACSGLSRRGLETTEREASAERRPTLTAPARAGFQHMWVGTKKRDSKSNKETGDEERGECREIALDFKGLIQGVAWKRRRGGEPSAAASLDGPCARCPAQRAGRDEGTASWHEQRNCTDQGESDDIVPVFLPRSARG